ncbi:MAG: enoyl-CoA hydratase-related protein [Phycisphaerales bacterium]
MSELTTLTVDGNIARLTLCREDKRNALSIPMLKSLHGRLDELIIRNDVSVCVLTGAGKSFCAGMDLRAIIGEPGAAAELLGSLAEATLKLRGLEAAVIGRINGAAIGGGCGLVAVCDMAITHPDAKLGYPEVDLGVCPAVVAPWLVESIGAGAARRVLLQGGVMSGAEAYDLGLVSALADASELDAAVDDLANHLAAAGPKALKATKRLLNELNGDHVAAAVRRGAAISAEIVEGEEAQTRLRKTFGID